jgi:hypothetical protein
LYANGEEMCRGCVMKCETQIFDRLCRFATRQRESQAHGDGLNWHSKLPLIAWFDKLFENGMSFDYNGGQLA